MKMEEQELKENRNGNSSHEVRVPRISLESDIVLAPETRRMFDEAIDPAVRLFGCSAVRLFGCSAVRLFAVCCIAHEPVAHLFPGALGVQSVRRRFLRPASGGQFDVLSVFRSSPCLHALQVVFNVCGMCPGIGTCRASRSGEQ